MGTLGFRLVINLSSPSQFVCKVQNKVALVLSSISKGDWMISVGVKGNCFPVPVQKSSRNFFRFSFRDGVPFQSDLFWVIYSAPGVHHDF